MAKFNGVSGLELRTDNNVRDVTSFFSSFTWIESMIAGGFFFRGRFAVDQWEDYVPLLLGRDRPRFQFRLKSTEKNSDSTTDWRTAYIDGSASSFEATALASDIRGGDKRLLMRQKHRTRAWSNSTIADVVSAVAAEYDLMPVVEETTNRRDRFQLRETDWHAVKRLAGEASTASGRGDTFVWVDEDKLRFGAPGLTGPSDRRHDLSEQETRADKVVVSYAGREVDRLGGATLIGAGFDWVKAAPVTFTVDEGAAGTLPALATKVPRKQADGLRVVPITETGSQGVEEGARSVWGRAGPRYFSLRVDTKPDLTLRPGMIVEVQVTLDGERTTPFLGRFSVLEVQHTLQGGGIVTTASCFRREAFKGDDPSMGAAASGGSTRDGYVFGQTNQPRTVVKVQVLDG